MGTQNLTIPNRNERFELKIIIHDTVFCSGELQRNNYTKLSNVENEQKRQPQQQQQQRQQRSKLFNLFISHSVFGE